MLANEDMTGYEVRKYLGDRYDDIFTKGYARGEAAGYVGTDVTLYAREYAAGYAIGERKVVRNLKAMGISVNVIVEVTSLTEEEIAKI